MHLSRSSFWLALVGVAASGLGAADPAPSQGDEHLRRWLLRFPEADADRDGRLTAVEAWQYQGDLPQRSREQQARRERAIVEAATAGRPVPVEPRLQPHLADVRYGPHDRNFLDLWLARSSGPAPWVIFFHGGAPGRSATSAIFTTRRSGPASRAGISVAAVNYRFTASAPLPAQFLDGARAVQFLRSRAAAWNLDPKRVAAYGASAGAIMSLWLGFHPDLADPKSRDPIARQSTRLTCVGSVNGQCTINPFVIRDWIGEPAFQHGVFPTAFGVKSHAELSDPRAASAVRPDVAPLAPHARRSAGLCQLHGAGCAAAGGKAKRGQGMHHPIFGHKLKAAMEGLGLECHYVHVADLAGDPELAMVQFFRRKFGRP
jgi:acetyl esterase